MIFTNAKKGPANYRPELYFPQAVGVKRGDKRFVMSRSELVEFMICPSRWLAGAPDKDTKSLTWGTLVDGLLLDGGLFIKRFAVCPETYQNTKGEESEWSRKSKYCKEWEDDKIEEGFIIVKAAQLEEAKKAITRLLADPTINEYLECCENQVLVTAEYKDAKTGLVIPFKSLIDLWPDKDHPRFRSTLGDLKTTRNAHPANWPKEVFNHSYHIQAASNLELAVAATGEDRNTFIHLLSENVEPYETGREMLSTEYIDMGKAMLKAGLEFYAKCLTLPPAEWPGYFEYARDKIDGFAMCAPDPWMILKEISIPELSSKISTAKEEEKDDQTDVIP